MPVEITEANETVAEVRFVCDCCGENIGTRVMLREEAEAQMKTKVVCQKCRKNGKACQINPARSVPGNNLTRSRTSCIFCSLKL